MIAPAARRKTVIFRINQKHSVTPAKAGVHSLRRLPQRLMASIAWQEPVPQTLAEGTNGSRLSPG
tara:strand:+ start:151897 stop:152091 length:195 start_codon:yes stop_codon:yes gene_type:complete